MNKSVPILLILCFYLSGCSSAPEEQEETLRLLDVQTQDATQSDVFVKPKSEEEIKKAYYDYIQTAPANDKSRMAAINRLAELEMNRINELVKNARASNDDAMEDTLYKESLYKTLSLLETSLREYPDAQGNDKTLYQLARTYDQLGEYEQSLAALKQLATQYPKSPFYAEAQFRVGESAFIEGDYITAEDSYSEAIFTSDGDAFYERSLFKRGWSRYKQGLYIEAADDYVAALKNHRFEDYEQLSSSEKDQFDEYFRAIGLAFANLESAEALQEYFADAEDFKYLYHTYSVISDIYLQQERFSDAAETLEQFISSNPQSPKIPRAYLKMIDIWKNGKFKSRFQESLENFYLAYNPKSDYWVKNNNESDQKLISDALREYILLVATYYQEDYQLNPRNKTSVQQASHWYKRYLEHYSAYAQQDKVYTVYADLLTAENQHQEALGYYELAAYDGTIVLNKDAAYATIVLTNKLLEQDKNNPVWLDKHIQYSLISAQLYQGDARYHAVALHAAELAFNKERFAEAIALTNSLPDAAADKILYDANVLKGLAYLQQQSFSDAETIFADLLGQPRFKKDQKKLQDNLALAIYQQAEFDLKNNQTESAIQHYARVAQRAPNSEIAPKALYEAVALSMKHEQWNNAVVYIQQFQKLYPKHPLNKDATRQLSTAYLNSGQGEKAAYAFEQISAQDGSEDVKMAALWKAAELYESKNDTKAAIRAYGTYAKTYKRPYPQYMEAMYKLTALYKKERDQKNVIIWQENITAADKQAAKNIKTDRTNFIASNITLEQAQQKHSQFSDKKLVEPLATNLRTKKALMQEAIALYGQASIYSYPEITTESTHAIGAIYQEFASSLLNSERPKHLKGEELEQYNILIEDQAFPFEEKAIEFYEINLARTKDGTHNQWLVNSFNELVKLFPVRYNRKGKLDIYHE